MSRRAGRTAKFVSLGCATVLDGGVRCSLPKSPFRLTSATVRTRHEAPGLIADHVRGVTVQEFQAALSAVSRCSATTRSWPACATFSAAIAGTGGPSLARGHLMIAAPRRLTLEDRYADSTADCSMGIRVTNHDLIDGIDTVVVVTELDSVQRETFWLAPELGCQTLQFRRFTDQSTVLSENLCYTSTWQSQIPVSSISKSATNPLARRNYVPVSIKLAGSRWKLLTFSG